MIQYAELSLEFLQAIHEGVVPMELAVQELFPEASEPTEDNIKRALDVIFLIAWEPDDFQS